MNELTKKIKIILPNGFTYTGYQQPTDLGFTQIKDEKDGKIRKFPNSAISVIEVL